ncbi:hypothetical protein [Ruminococcus champanellensis]|uniref:hypothetical protein n=1 Tax=Ruminococcus champanellensis TaxID=1161942 RepID=UPI00248CBB5D|nr:hypothetical protein [Ruminococcus champanellensis]
MAFMSLALSFMTGLTLEELVHKLSEPILETLIIVIVFVLIPQYILGAVLLARGCSACSREGRTAHAIALQCIGVILLLPMMLFVLFQPISFLVSIFFIFFA